MARIILVLLIVVAALAVISTLMRSGQTAVDTIKEAGVPKTAQTVSYVLLIVLMFGVVTGGFGGL